MHVLFVIDTWGLVGGTERHASVTVPALIERGHQVTVLCREDRHPGTPHPKGVRLVALPQLEGRTMTEAELGALAQELAAIAPDVILHSACANVDAAEALLDAAPVVRFVHDHVVFCPGLNKLHRDGTPCRDPMGTACFVRYYLKGGCAFFQRPFHKNSLLDPFRAMSEKRRELALARRAAHTLTNSEHMRAELLCVGFESDRTSVLHLFTASSTPEQPRGPLTVELEAFLEAGDGPLLVTSARLVPEKGVGVLLEALATLAPPYRALVAGTGPAEVELRERLSELDLEDRVRFTGFLPSDQLEELYARADVVLCPSTWDEPFGLIGLEAMAHGKPVVAFRVGGVPEWLQDGETGFLVARGDAPAMARAIERLTSDAELRGRLGGRGRALLHERFTRALHVEGLERALVSAATSNA